jgi:hypothetical protein
MAKKRLTDITQANLDSLGVKALADRPNRNNQYGVSGLDAQGLKAWFDNLNHLSADKINAIHRMLFSEEAAEYIGLKYAKEGMACLDDFIEKFVKGTAAEEILKVYPNLHTTQQISLQSAIYNLAQSISDFGYGYTGAVAEYYDYDEDPEVQVEVEDYEGGKRLRFKFYNIAEKGLEKTYNYKGQLFKMPDNLTFRYDSTKKAYMITGRVGELGSVLYIHPRISGYVLDSNGKQMYVGKDALVGVESLDLTGVTDLIIGRYVNVYDNAFTNTGDLKNITICGYSTIYANILDTNPSDLHTIEEQGNTTFKKRAFYGIDAKVIKIGNALHIEEEAFAFPSTSKSGKLCEFYITSQNEIGRCAFEYRRISSDSVVEATTIRPYAFSHGSGFPSKINAAKIYEYAFCYQSVDVSDKSPTITIGDSCNKIGHNAFYKDAVGEYADNFVTFIVEGNPTLEYRAFFRKRVKLIMPKVSEIPSNFFYIPSGNTYEYEIVELDISGCKTIGNLAFGSDINLSLDYRLRLPKIEWSNNLLIIGDDAFLGARMHNIYLPHSLKKIGAMAFAFTTAYAEGYDNIVSVYCNNCTFGSNAFAGNDILGSWVGVRFDLGNAHKFLSNKFVNPGANPLTNALCLYEHDSEDHRISTLYIRSGITNVAIGDYVLSSCKNVETIDFGEFPISISPNAFNTNHVKVINCPWSEGYFPNAPWGANNATVYYYT